MLSTCLKNNKSCGQTLLGAVYKTHTAALPSCSCHDPSCDPNYELLVLKITQVKPREIQGSHGFHTYMLSIKAKHVSL